MSLNPLVSCPLAFQDNWLSAGMEAVATNNSGMKVAWLQRYQPYSCSDGIYVTSMSKGGLSGGMINIIETYQGPMSLTWLDWDYGVDK